MNRTCWHYYKSTRGYSRKQLSTMSLFKLTLAMASLTSGFAIETKNNVDNWNTFILSICNKTGWESLVFVSDKQRDIEHGLIAGMNGCFHSCANIFISKNRTKEALKYLNILYRESGFLNAIVNVGSKNLKIMLKEMANYPLLWSVTSCWIVKAVFPWFLRENITNLLYRELNVAFVIRNSTCNGYTIYVVNCEGNMKSIVFTTVYWAKDSKDFPLLFNTSRKYARDLGGKKFKFALEKHFPFYLPKKTKPEGADIYLLDMLSQYLNFSYEIHRPKDRKWGSKKNGIWNGMIGMVQKQEVHGALGGMSIIPNRLEAVEFSIAYAFDRTSFVVKTPDEISRKWVIFRPFTWEVWLAIAIANIFAALCLSLAENMAERFVHRCPTLAETKFIRLKIQDAFFYIYRSAVNQGCYNPYSNSARVFLVGWWLFVITVIARYSGTLVSFMTNPGSNHPVDTIAELVEMIKAGKYTCGTIKDSADHDIFRTKSSEIFRIILQAMESKESNFVNNDVSGLQKCKKEDYAYIAGKLTTEADIYQKGAFVFSQDSFHFFGYGIAFVKGFWYREAFDRIISRLIYGGLINEEIRKSISKKQIFIPEAVEKRSLSMYDLQGVFFVLFIGLLFSTLTLIAELLIYFITKPINKITPTQSLTKDGKLYNTWFSDTQRKKTFLN